MRWSDTIIKMFRAFLDSINIVRFKLFSDEDIINNYKHIIQMLLSGTRLFMEAEPSSAAASQPESTPHFQDYVFCCPLETVGKHQSRVLTLINNIFIESVKLLLYPSPLNYAHKTLNLFFYYSIFVSCLNLVPNTLTRIVGGQ